MSEDARRGAGHRTVVVLDRGLPVWSTVADLVSRSPRAVIVVLDLEPAIANWDGSDAEAAEEIRAVVAELDRSAPVGSRYFIVTNAKRAGLRVSPDAGVDGLVTSARKPWTHRRLLPEQVDWVVGDQWLTDGILALRLRANLIVVPLPAAAPWWPRFQQSVGSKFAPLIRHVLAGRA